MYILYLASALGGLSLYLMMPRLGYNPIRIGALLGAMTLGGLWLVLAERLPEALGVERAAFAYYYVFSALAIGSATRVVTHQRPVYAALWFVMVVLACAGLLLALSAEFMAIAMVIVYGGAILVTYVFVIMLASQSGQSRDSEQSWDEAAAAQANTGYDWLSYEPAAAVAAGCVLLASLLGAAFVPLDANEAARGRTDEQVVSEYLTQRPAVRLAARVAAQGDAEGASVLASASQLTNAERVGLDLFDSHPLGLELAGVILLVSLVGAVVIARKRVELEPVRESSRDRLAGG